MPSDRLTVSFCCNDAGNLPDAVSTVQVGELIQLEGPMDLYEAELVAVTPFLWIRKGLWLGGRWFRHHGRQQYVGSILWDSAEMDRSEVVRLLNHLRTLGGWSCIEAETSLFEAWRGREITVADLERAIGI